MRVGYVINQFPPNVTAGLGRYAEEISPYLVGARGPGVAPGEHELIVFTVNDGRQEIEQRLGPITVYRPLGRVLGAVSRRRRLNRTHRGEFVLLGLNVVMNNWRYFRRLRRTAPDQRPDVIALHDSTNFLCGLLSHYVLRLPVVFHVHTTEYGVAPQRSIVDPLNVFARLERWLARIARRVVVATPEVREQLVADGWASEKIEVVSLGGTFERVLADGEVDRRRLREGAASLRERLGIAPDALVLLFVGRLERQKGIYQLLEAMRRVVPAVGRLRLVMVGEGDVAGVARIVSETGLDGRVVAEGRFVTGQALMEYYELADACVFPSIFEPFGLVATEAMALAKPTILGDGFSQIFLGDPRRPAVRFARSTDPDDIARVVIEVMTSESERDALGRRGERLVRERLSWASAARETLRVYHAVCEPTRSSVPG